MVQIDTIKYQHDQAFQFHIEKPWQNFINNRDKQLSVVTVIRRYQLLMIFYKYPDSQKFAKLFLFVEFK